MRYTNKTPFPSSLPSLVMNRLRLGPSPESIFIDIKKNNARLHASFVTPVGP